MLVISERSAWFYAFVLLLHDQFWSTNDQVFKRSLYWVCIFISGADAIHIMWYIDSCSIIHFTPLWWWNVRWCNAKESDGMQFNMLALPPPWWFSVWMEDFYFEIPLVLWQDSHRDICLKILMEPCLLLTWTCPHEATDSNADKSDLKKEF